MLFTPLGKSSRYMRFVAKPDVAKSDVHCNANTLIGTSLKWPLLTIDRYIEIML